MISKLAGRATASWLSVAASAVVSFLLTPLLVHSLGLANYGLWVLAASVVSYMGLLDLGLRAAVLRFVGQLATVGDNEEASSRFAAIVALRAAISILILALAAILAVVGGRAFSLDPLQAADFRLTVMLLGGSLATTMFGGVFAGLLVVRERFVLLAILDIVSALGYGLLAVHLLGRGVGIVGLAGARLALSVGMATAWTVLALRCMPEIRPHFRLVRRENIRGVLRFSGPILVLHVGNQIINYSDSVVAAIFTTPTLVAEFAIALSLIEYSRQIIFSLSNLFGQRIHAAVASTRSDLLEEAFIRYTRIVSLLAYAIVVTLIVRGDSFLKLWLGDVVSSRSTTILQFLSVALSLSMINVTAYVLATAKGLHGRPARWALIEAALNLGLSVILVQRVGIVGIAVATLLAALPTHVILWPRFLARELRIPVMTFVKRAWLVPAAAVAPFALMTMAAEMLAVESLFGFFLGVGLCITGLLLTVIAVPALRRDLTLAAR